VPYSAAGLPRNIKKSLKSVFHNWRSANRPTGVMNILMAPLILQSLLVLMNIP
jgi:hypothetical protein